MKLGCTNCGTLVDPNSDEAEWLPPVVAEGENPAEVSSVGSIRCPNCRTVSNFLDWKLRTGG
jgi:hypothetical protein